MSPDNNAGNNSSQPNYRDAPKSGYGVSLPTIPRGILRGSLALTIAAAILAWATIWGRQVQKNPDVKLGAAPLVGQWKFHPSIGYLMPIGLALFVIVAVPKLFVRLQTRWVVLTSIGLTSAFTAALAGADGGVAMLAPVVHRTEYLAWLDKMPPVRQMLTNYDQYDFIVNFSTHIKGHPPGYVLVLKSLAALGVAKPWIVACVSYVSAGVVAGSALVVARRFGSAKLARRAAPFLILAPYAVWMGTSADAFFSALVAMGAAGIAMASTSVRYRRRIGFALLAGLLLGIGLYSSWGTVTCGPIIVAALWWGSAWPRSLAQPVQVASNDPNEICLIVHEQTNNEQTNNEQTNKVSGIKRFRNIVPVTGCGGRLALRCWPGAGMKRFRNIVPVTGAALSGIAVVAAGMTSLGYNWFAGIGLTRRLYLKGTAQFRPWRYFMVGNLGALLLAIGAVAVVGIGNLGLGPFRHRSRVLDSTKSNSTPCSPFAPTASDKLRSASLGTNNLKEHYRKTHNRRSEAIDCQTLRWLRVCVLAGLICVLAADFSQYSKGEVERIWLPFMPWLTLPAAVLAHHRFWLIVQASFTIGLQLLLISKW